MWRNKCICTAHTYIHSWRQWHRTSPECKWYGSPHSQQSVQFVSAKMESITTGTFIFLPRKRCVEKRYICQSRFHLFLVKKKWFGSRCCPSCYKLLCLPGGGCSCFVYRFYEGCYDSNAMCRTNLFACPLCVVPPFGCHPLFSILLLFIYLSVLLETLV